MGAVNKRRVREVLTAALAQSDRVVTLTDARGRAAQRAMVRMLRDAQDGLEAKLRRETANHGGPHERFTGAAAEAYRQQLITARWQVERRMAGVTIEAARGSAVTGYRRSARLLERLEVAHGGSVEVSQLLTASRMNRALRDRDASLVGRVATSVDRYGRATTELFERTIARGLLMGSSQTEIIDALVGHGGPTGVVSMAAVEVAPGVVQRLRLEAIPEGLFRRYRYWATRLVRTEVANAQNGAALELMRASAEHMPGLQKKIIAVMDARTAPDSIAVHGQVRPLDGLFVDGAGREYEHPPARPNDREVIIPWRPEWEETELTEPVPADELDEEIAKQLERIAAAG